MKKRLTTLGLVAVLSGLLGVGYATSSRHAEPGPAPARDEPVALADLDGGILKCNGKVVKVRRSDLPGAKLDPAPPRQRRPALAVSSFSCVRGLDGKETGAVSARISDGTISTRSVVPSLSG